ncbi:MAG TPA: glycoside hydrolase family 6 protein [Polyangiaceae bacterium]|nr:glycoside hydrolase family 6 protein [Polyangiaceae bacterium]
MPPHLGFRKWLLLGSSALALASTACRSSHDAASPTGAASQAEPGGAAAVTGNPFAGIALYRAPYSNAENAQRNLEKTNPAEAALVGKIAAQPQASWFGGWSGDITTAVRNYVNAAERAGQLALLVAYNVPNRDCGSYSAGGASDPGAYATWIEGFAEGIGDRRAVVVLEPDALPLLAQCLSEVDQAKRLELIRHAALVLEARPGVAVYLDAGHSNWAPAAVMVERLKQAGIAKARGFSLNVSNFEADANLLAYGHELVNGLGGDVHFVIDSSRNGNGPAPTDPESWCNPEGRALGRAPTADTGDPALDAFVWVKRPGESDGECKGGPPAGQWFAARAVEMARNAKW